MKRSNGMITLLGTLCLLAPAFRYSQAQPETDRPRGTQVHVVITDMAVQDDAELPRLSKEDISVKQGKNTLTVTQLLPARDQAASLQLMVLIDDTLNTSAVGNNLNDIREFIKAQPPSAAIGIGYMANAGVNVVQQFTTDHELAVKAIRLPRGSFSSMDSPYLSLISLAKGWPQQNIRRVVLMVTDGIDRLRGDTPTVSQLVHKVRRKAAAHPSITACPP